MTLDAIQFASAGASLAVRVYFFAGRMIHPSLIMPTRVPVRYWNNVQEGPGPPVSYRNSEIVSRR
jgi:hypothetical protein